MTNAFIALPSLSFSHSRRFPASCSPTRLPRFTMTSNVENHKVLMLCLGNICRSPAAEAVMKNVVSRRGLDESFFVDSCGTGGGSPNWYLEDGFSYHQGDEADPRMRAAARKRGLDLLSKSRPLCRADFYHFDLIIAMDESNIESINTAKQHWNVAEDAPARVALMSRFSPDDNFRGRAVPDPYWSGEKGFELALDLIEGACEGLVDELIASETKS